MQVYDLLSLQDRELIREYINAYGGVEGSETYVTASMEHILRFWSKNKEFLAELFGGQLILEKEIDIKRPESILIEDMEKVICNYEKPLVFVQNFNNFIYNNFYSKSYLTYEDLHHLLDTDTLVSNYYDFPSVDVPVPGANHPIRVQNGCKVMKILSKLAKTFNIDGFEEFRIAHSMVLNQKRFKGTLCLSIHPLDYMTMSDNACEWDSCMSWQHDGEYRLGTVEMMNSPYIIVAYLKSEKDFQLFNDDKEELWNNKRWRELFIVTPEILSAIKGYPYTDKDLRSIVFQWILELMEHNYPQYEFFPEEYEISNHKFINIHDKISIKPDFNFHAMYNDFYGTHPAYFSNQIFNHKDGEYFTLILSGETSCMICGDDWTVNYSDWDTEFLICPECSGVRKCYECGEYVDYDDIVELADGTYMCRWCADQYATRCDYCDDVYSDNNITKVYARHLGRLDSNATICLCNDCYYHSAGLKEIIGPITYERRGPWSMSQVPQADTNNFTTDGYYLFGYLDSEIEDMKAENVRAKQLG